jgi:23S rRNA G2445 N2-methylase RlmL
LPFPAGSFDVILADLPWGGLSGSHAANRELYPQALAEAARVAAPGARAVMLTHEVNLMRRTLSRQALWRQEDELRVFQGGLRPRVYVLSKIAAAAAGTAPGSGS